MAGKKIRLGGPNLGPGPVVHCVIRPVTGGIRDAFAGEEFEFDSIEDAQGYVDRGMATIVNEGETKAPRGRKE